MTSNTAEAAYLIASLLFIIGLKRLSSPRTARSGNIAAAVGMALALGGTFVLPGMGNFGWILLAIVLGTIPGWLLARRVKMTAMPQMVSLFNGMGGACALLISLAEWFKMSVRFTTPIRISNSISLELSGSIYVPRTLGECAPMLLGVIFGAISFTGSLVAFGKLQGVVTEKPVRLPGQNLINIGLVVAIFVTAILAAHRQDAGVWIILLAIAALALGVVQVMPIGGAD